MRREGEFISLFWFAALIAVRVFASQSNVLVSVTGEGLNPTSYSLEQLQKLPLTKVSARDNDGKDAEYSGVSLAEILRRAGAPLGDQLRGAALRKAVVIHAADGYQAVFALAEVDPGMTDKIVLLAWTRDSQPLVVGQGPLRLIVPGEKRQARWVRQVTAIEMVTVDRPAITNAPPQQ